MGSLDEHVDIIVLESSEVSLHWKLALGFPLYAKVILDIQVPLIPCGHRFPQVIPEPGSA
jgi:hypothetical protein